MAVSGRSPVGTAQASQAIRRLSGTDGAETLPPVARAYVAAVLAVGAGALIWSVAAMPQTASQWLAFGTLCLCAGLAQLFPVITPGNQAYYLTIVFVSAGIVLLPSGGVALLVVAAFVAEQLRSGYRWHVQLFNTANLLLDALVAQAVYLRLAGGAHPAGASLVSLLVVLLAVGVFATLNHLVLAGILHLAHGHSWRATRLFEPGNLLTDAALAGIGFAIAFLWQDNPWLALIAAAPTFLSYRALRVPSVEDRVRIDARTGLYNARHFHETLDDELSRARRFGRPIAVVIADIDSVHAIERAHWTEPAGGTVMGVAQAIRKGIRSYDVAAYRGRGEFVIVLPEASSYQGRIVAERIRGFVEAASFGRAVSGEPVRATLSIGVASYPDHGDEPGQIVRHASLALLGAVLQGGNRSVVADLGWVDLAKGPADSGNAAHAKRRDG